MPVAALALGLAACGTTPPLRWHRLPLVAEGVAGVATPSATPSTSAFTGPARHAERWELVREIVLPEYLQRDTMLIDTGSGHLQALPQDRWAEPLQDALPRLLLHDLIALHGAQQVWAAPAPLDVRPTQRLRVQILALETDSSRGRLVLRARCTWQALQGIGASRVQAINLEVPVAASTAAALVHAHRTALFALAARVGEQP